MNLLRDHNDNLVRYLQQKIDILEKDISRYRARISDLEILLLDQEMMILHSSPPDDEL